MRKIIFCLVLIIFFNVTENIFAQTEILNQPREGSLKNYFLKRYYPPLEKINSAIKYSNERNLEDAIQQLIEAIKISPSNYKAYSLLAQFYYMLGKEDKAFRTLEDAGANFVNNDRLFEDFYDSIKLFNKNKNSKNGIYIAKFKDDKKCAFSFTFDDGAQNIYTNIFPLFDKFRYKATVFIIVGSTKEERFEGMWTGLWDEWRDALNRGFDIGNHTMSHKDLTRISVEELDFEINESYNVISSKLKKPPVSFMAPLRSYDNRSIKKIMEKHFVMRNHDFLNNLYENIFIPIYGGKNFSESTANIIVDIALENNLWVIPEMHSLKDNKLKKQFKPVTEEFILSHLSYIKEREKNIWVDTLPNIYRYLFARKMMNLVVEEKLNNSAKISLEPINDFKSGGPLTLVIDNSLKPSKASAYLRETKKILPVKIVENKILVEVMPEKQSIDIQWE